MMSSIKITQLCAFVIFWVAVCDRCTFGSPIEHVELQAIADGKIPWMFIPDDEGIPHLALFPKTWHKYNGDIHKDVKFNLYTRSNQNTPYRLYVNNVNNLELSGFNRSLPTKIIIHGFNSNGGHTVIIGTKNAYLKKSEYNIIGVDWSVLCPWPLYPAAVENAELVGNLVGELIEFLVNQTDAKLSDFHVIGHSLGGQAAGFAGAAVTIGKIARITGLDSAYPMFGNRNATGRLDPSDAVLVDAIHTCGGLVGFREPYAHIDFFPNGGTSPQPGCEGEDATGGCSHGKVVNYFIQTISEPLAYPAVECLNLEEAEARDCTGQPQQYMGDTLYFGVNGIYFVDTRR